MGANNLQLFYQSWYPLPVRKDSSQSAVEGDLDVFDLQEDSADFPGSDIQAPTDIKGVLAIVHGLGEHSGRYCQIVSGLTAAGYAVFGFDNQGHGKSEGQRGHIDRWQDYRENTQAFLSLIRQQEPTAPLFLMGHSLGGLIVLDYVLRSSNSAAFQTLNVQGLIVSAPPFQPTIGTASRRRMVLARLLSRLLPRFSLNMGLNQGGLSRDPSVADQAAEDPLTHSSVTLRWGSETLSTLAWVKDHIDQLTLPLLLTHGEADPIISPSGSKMIFQQVNSRDKTLKIYPGSYHEPHNDLDANTVVSDLLRWIEESLAR
ncbi:hydrolase, alpha/beta fold family protein [Synechococcus sp. PCC 7335]|nr:hydrolase, alpha/beta fold family protein [Synechococcus sp. PCC 7335]